jgi:hypothetical protein
MSIKLTETQTTMLSAAIREVKAKGDAPMWRRDEEAGCDYALKLTAAGLNAITAVAAEFDGSRGVQRPYPGGIENRYIFETVSRLNPKTRAASRRLLPSLKTN